MKYNPLKERPNKIKVTKAFLEHVKMLRSNGDPDNHRKFKSVLLLPSIKCLDIEELHRQEMVDENTVFLMVEKDPEVAEKIFEIHSKTNSVVNKGCVYRNDLLDLKTSDILNKLKHYGLEKLDFMYLDTCSTPTPKLLSWIEHMCRHVLNKDGSVVTNLVMGHGPTTSTLKKYRNGVETLNDYDNATCGHITQNKWAAPLCTAMRYATKRRTDFCINYKENNGKPMVLTCNTFTEDWYKKLEDDYRWWWDNGSWDSIQEVQNIGYTIKEHLENSFDDREDKIWAKRADHLEESCGLRWAQHADLACQSSFLC